MAFQAYVSIKGSKQGQLKGESVKANRKSKWIEVLGFELKMNVPLDTLDGKRTPPPVVVPKQLGNASPALFSMQVNSESLSNIPRFSNGGSSSGSGASGGHTHPPLVVSKQLGGATPQLFAAHWAGEVLTEVTLEVADAGSSGTEKVVNRITLTNAVISKVEPYVGRLASAGQGNNFTFTYQQIRYNGVVKFPSK
jgi:type VI protein secretion system component Hcp